MLGTPRASTHRLLVSLREAGMLEVVEGGRYRLSMRVFELGSRVPVLPQLMEVARRPLEILTEAVGTPALLGVREGTEVLFIDRFAHRATPLAARMGTRGPLHATAMGKVLLAGAPVEVVEQVLAAPLRAYTPYTVVDPGQLLAQLATIRERGVAYVDQERRLGIFGMAVPIRGPVGQVIAGIDIPGPRAVVMGSQRKRELLLRQAAAEVERAIRLRTSRRRTVHAGTNGAAEPRSG